MLSIKTLALRWCWIPLLLIPLIIVGSYELAIHFPIHHKQHTSHLSQISFPNTTVPTAQRIFPGFSIWQPTELDGLNFPESCQTALTRKILCEDTVQGYDGPAWRGSIEDKKLYDEVCDASCGASLRSYYQDVSQACAGYNITGAPLTMDGGYMWEAWNETCYIEPQSGRYCNGMHNASKIPKCCTATDHKRQKSLMDSPKSRISTTCLMYVLFFSHDSFAFANNGTKG